MSPTATSDEIRASAVAMQSGTGCASRSSGRVPAAAGNLEEINAMEMVVFAMKSGESFKKSLRE
jgi:hypothetical protein